jgi:hypothetical protein
MTEVKTEVVEKARRFELTEEERVQRLTDLQELMHDLVVGLTGRETVIVTVPDSATWQSRNDILVKIAVDSEEQLRLTIGPRKATVQSILQFLRIQQVMPHNKIINLVLETTDGSVVQTFKDAHLFGSRRNVRDDFYGSNGIAAPHTRSLSHSSRKDKPAPSASQTKAGEVAVDGKTVKRGEGGVAETVAYEIQLAHVQECKGGQMPMVGAKRRDQK